ncbi:hypothetical protein PVK06_019298 [Gossypium arboreum]|uniref:Uncharacterized protein n=1 Tax=Gossypium arboreum TaxID=29729 RepID=A0ABR0PJG2_GOSAR|nr:hypothetical protein PVK06_019298 [Gossypium arboreum]
MVFVQMQLTLAPLRIVEKGFAKTPIIHPLGFNATVILGGTNSKSVPSSYHPALFPIAHSTSIAQERILHHQRHQNQCLICPTLVAIPGAVMAAVRQRGVATNAIAMQAPIICAIPQPYPVSTHVSFLTLGFESCSNLLHILAATVLCIGSGSLGADCHDLGVGTPPRDHSSSPPGLREIRKVSPIEDSWTLLILGAIFLPLL